MRGKAGRIDVAGRGAAWLARLTGGQEVGSSNLPGPTEKVQVRGGIAWSGPDHREPPTDI
jgi:hypothetical protein